jgi:DNA modification methylase
VPAKPSALVDTRVIYCGDNLDQLRKLPDGCVDLIYIDPAFNSNRNYGEQSLLAIRSTLPKIRNK